MEESGTKLHISLVLKHFVLFPQKLSECGRVFLYLYWAELESDKEREALVYNLGADSEQTFAGNRSFGISMNGTTVLDDFNIARDYGYARAVIKKFVVTVKDGKGLSVDFHKKEGEPILNAIRIYRNY